MKRPEVTLNNYEEVYDAVAEQQINPLLTRALHLGCAALYHPRVTYTDGAEEQIGEHLADDGRVILTSNHIQMFDQLVIASHMQNSVLRPMVGHTRVLAKKGYHELPWLRPALESVGGIPVWRAKDFEGQNVDNGIKIAISDKMTSIAAKCLDRNEHLFCFSEGTRNEGDITKLQKIMAGAGRIAVLAAEQSKVQIVPVGLCYGEGKKHSFSPRLHIGAPIDVRDEVAAIRRGLQDETPPRAAKIPVLATRLNRRIGAEMAASLGLARVG